LADEPLVSPDACHSWKKGEMLSMKKIALAGIVCLALLFTTIRLFIFDPSHSMAAAASATLVVNANQVLRPVTHVATGSLYGLASASVPSDSLVEPIKPNTFVQMAVGGRQQGSGDILVVAPEAARAGAKLVDRFSDYYAGWPYQYNASNWLSVVDSQISSIKASAYYNTVASYALWNEPDNTWLTSNGTFESFWTTTYREVRAHDATKPIQGPSFSDNISDMQNFLQNAVTTNTVPDIIAWHELSNSSKIAGDVATVTGIEQRLGITPRPIAIEEYAAPSEVGIPGPLVGYITKFERLGIHDAELAFWNQSGALGDLLTKQGGSPNAAYWLYTWYAAMSGNMIVTTPPAQTGIDGFASVPTDNNQVSIVVGNCSGSCVVTVNGLNALNLGSTVSVEIEQTVSAGRTVAVSGPSAISTTTYTPTNGTISIPITMSTNNAYHITITGSGAIPTATSTIPPTATSRPGTATPVPPTATPGSSACKVTYTVSNQWTGGFSANVTIANTGSAVINGWTLKFTFPAAGQAVTSGWSATWSQSGQNVSATNLSWNASLSPGASTSIGFNGAWTASNPTPTDFTLNGATCANG
jgi:Cellulose binding domain